LSRRADSFEGDNAKKIKDDQVAEIKIEEESSDNGSVEYFGI